MTGRLVAPHEYPRLAHVLGDTPATVIPLHQLRTGLGAATLAGTLDDPEALIIQANAEPTAFGRSAAAVAHLLNTLPNWFCVEIDLSLGHALAAQWAQEGKPNRLYGDDYYILTGPLISQPPPALETRLLTPADIPAWRAAPPEFQSLGFADHATLLDHGQAAGSFARGELIALAHTSAFSSRYADIGVYTHPDYRGQSLAAFAAQLVMAQVIAKGRTPLWSTGEDNHASKRLAQKLGLCHVLSRTYVILDPQP